STWPWLSSAEATRPKATPAVAVPGGCVVIARVVAGVKRHSSSSIRGDRPRRRRPPLLPRRGANRGACAWTNCFHSQRYMVTPFVVERIPAVRRAPDRATQPPREKAAARRAAGTRVVLCVFKNVDCWGRRSECQAKKGSLPCRGRAPG